MINMGRRQGYLVLVIEDDALMAATLTDLLTALGHRVLHAADASEAWAFLEDETPDLVILDLMLPDQEGLVLYLDLKAVLDVPVIVCSGSRRGSDIALSLRLGAEDFVAKPFTASEFQARVEAVLRRTQRAKVPSGKPPWLARPPELPPHASQFVEPPLGKEGVSSISTPIGGAARLSGHADSAQASSPVPLTPREQEVAALIAQGLSNRQIAEVLVIAKMTADKHVGNILQKLTVERRAEVAVWAAEHGLLGRLAPL